MKENIIFENNLVGPKPEDQEKDTLEVTADGQPLWMAFLNDPDTLTLSKEEAQDAKNALIAFKNEHPEVVSICSQKKISDCRTTIASMGINSEAA